jgi:peptide chain release factor 1
MLDKLAGIENRYEEINRLLLEVGNDYQRAAELNKERIDLENIVGKSKEYCRDMVRLDEAHAVIGSVEDQEMRQLAESEIADLEPRVVVLEKELKLLLVPKDPRDEKNVFVEIRAGTGGEEAAIFAADLYRMYTRYAERQNWKVEMMDSNAIGVGSLRAYLHIWVLLRCCP